MRQLGASLDFHLGGYELSHRVDEILLPLTAAASVKDFRGAVLHLHNPTAFPASVKVMCEKSGDMRRPLGPTPGFGLPRIEVSPGAIVAVNVLIGQETLVQTVDDRD